MNNRYADFHYYIYNESINGMSVLVLEDLNTPGVISLTNSIEKVIDMTLKKTMLNLHFTYIIEKSSDGEFSLVTMKSLNSNPSWEYLGMTIEEAIIKLKQKK